MSLYIKLICRDVTSDEFFEKNFFMFNPYFSVWSKSVIKFRPYRRFVLNG